MNKFIKTNISILLLVVMILNGTYIFVDADRELLKEYPSKVRDIDLDNWEYFEYTDKDLLSIIRLKDYKGDADEIYIPSIKNRDGNWEKYKLEMGHGLGFLDRISHQRKVKSLIIEALPGPDGEIYRSPFVDTGSIPLGEIAFVNTFLNNNVIENIDLSGIDSSRVEVANGMFNGATNLKKINLSGWDVNNLRDATNMFHNTSSLERIIGIEDLNTSNIGLEGTLTFTEPSLGGMFSQSGLEKLDLEPKDNGIWDTSNARDFKAMFADMPRLKELNGVGEWNTSSLMSIEAMFSGSTELVGDSSGEGLDLTPKANGVWDTSKVTNMTYAFQGTKKLAGIKGIDMWNTSNVKTMDWMFANTSGLNGEINLSTRGDIWNVGKVENMGLMFWGTNMTSLNVTGWDLSSIKPGINGGFNGLDGMFFGIKNLKSIKGIEDWNVSNIKDMSNMFNGTESLKYIDLSGWKLNKNVNITSMFSTNKPVPLLVKTKDDKLQLALENNANKERNNRITSGPRFNAGEGNFKDRSKEKVLFNKFYIEEDSDAILSEELLNDFIENNIPIKEGQTFSHWVDSKGNKFEVNGDIDVRNNNEVYTAVYKDAYNVTFKYEDDGENREKTIRILDGKTLKEEDIPETIKEGYEFVGWNTKVDGSGEYFDLKDPIREDKIFYAVYKRKTVDPIYPSIEYSVTFVNDGKEIRVKVRSGDILKEGDIPETIKEGYEFVGWNTKVDGSGEYFDLKKKITRSIKVHAIYRPVGIDFEHIAYLKGYEDKTIRANGNLTREEAAMVFYRLLDEGYKDNETNPSHNFPDVKEGRWSEKAIDTLTKIGILEGYEDGTFRPERAITRAELTTIVAKLVEENELRTSSFPDIKGHWAEEYIKKIESRDWIDGYEDGTFRPDAKIRRSEFAKIINRYSNREFHKKNIPDNILKFKDFDKSYSSKWYYEDLLEATNNHRGLIIDGWESWKEIF